MIPFFFVPPVSTPCRVLPGGAIAFVELFRSGSSSGASRASACGSPASSSSPPAAWRSPSACCSTAAAAGERLAQEAGGRRGMLWPRRSTRCSPASTSRSATPCALRRPAAHPRRRGLGQDARAHAPRRLSDQVHGVRPDEMVAITFTNKAAGEMKERIEGLVGPIARTMWISTFHSMCARMLRREAQRIGYKSSFTIHDEDDRRRLIKRCLEELNLDPKRFPPDALARQISDAKNQLVGPEEFRERIGGHFAQSAADVVRALREAPRGDERHGLRRPAHEDASSCWRRSRTVSALPAGLPLRAHRRVPGHQPRSVPARQPARRGASQPRRGRRRRPVHLLVARRRHPQHPRVRARLPGRQGDPPGAELPLHAGDPRRRQRGGHQQPQAQGQEPVDAARDRRAGPGRGGQRRARRGAVRGQRGAEAARGRGGRRRQGLPAGRDRRALPHQRAEPRARGAVRPLRASPTR